MRRFIFAFLGMLIRALTVGFASIGTSGRNTYEQEVAELNTTGIYSIVRNPLYIGNYLILLGVIMLTQDINTVLIDTAWIVFLVITLLIFSILKYIKKYRGLITSLFNKGLSA